MVWVATLAALLALGAGVLLWVAQREPVRTTAAIDFQERDWILITDFENRTGEPLFDGLIEYALARELGNSQFVNVVPPARINDTLSLMRLPAGVGLDVALGREIAERDSAIRALLAGRIELLGDTYVLTVQLLDARSGVIVAATGAEAQSDDIARSLRVVSDWAREAVGEPLPPVDERGFPMERVTTRSLEALKLYSQAMALSLSDGASWQVIESLLRQALESDNEFASAHILLAHALRNQSHPPEEYLPHAERAFAMAGTVRDRERYFIGGSYYAMLGQHEQAVEAFRALILLYPDDFWGTNNLAAALDRLRQRQEAALYRARRADLRPNNLLWNISAAIALAVTGSPAQALVYHERALALRDEDTKAAGVGSLLELEFFPALLAWHQGDGQAVLDEGHRIGEKIDDLSAAAGLRAHVALADLYASVGHTSVRNTVRQPPATYR